MRAPISVIIPTLNAQASLPGCLAALVEGVSSGLVREVIVTDGGSQDDTRQIADDTGAVWVVGAASRGGQLRRGAAQARGDWLLVLHADTVLQSGWSVHAARAVERPGAYYFRLQFRADGAAPRLVEGWANLRSRLLGLPYGDQGLLIDRARFDAAGGYPDIPLMEDVALARSLRGQLRGLPVRALTSAARYERAGWLRRGSRNLLTLARYFLGADPERLAQHYRR
ncbi:TIGR04283 family arsenosugar biosynthesis glycosyltransferase [Thalassococcus sp. BH17M4-6]|uniref:TIGR04283 family arsenosugar biosynthesis glycosyltransferase n=1 Tax=Thalassococcus sp. BH17M4-6 TaxID=3413148 RepID=UPI003BD5B897